MALYDKSREFFMKNELSDFKLTCNGRGFPVHRMILALHSEFFRRAFSSDFKEAKEGLMNFPDDDPEILEKVLSIMYRGNYDDKYYGKMTGPHSAVTMTSKELRISAEGGRRSCGRHEPDFDASLAIIQEYEEDRPAKMVECMLQCIQDALYINIMGHRFQCNLVIEISDSRYHEVLETYLDAGSNFQPDEFRTIAEYIDELYTNTPPDAALRWHTCNLIRNFTQKKPEEARKLRAALAGVITAHPSFQEDMRR